MSAHELDSVPGIHTCTGCLWAVFTYTDDFNPEGTKEAVNRAYAIHLLNTALEEAAMPITVHCMYCTHEEVTDDAQTSSDAMERHYWDDHYSQSDRDHLRSVGQKPERMGTKP